MRFAITHNTPPGAGGVPPPFRAGQSARIKPNKANKPPKITNHYENKNQ